MEEYKEILTSYHEKDYFKNNEEHVNECLEVIQNIINRLIECDHDNDIEIFESFCKNNIINDLTYLAIYVENYEVRFQIIKSFSMLILSLSNSFILNFIFSKNYLNRIIDIKSYIFNIEINYDFLSYYTNFLKSLSLKLNIDNIEFFYNSYNNTFKLLENALSLYNYNDNMIINVVRNIFLTVGKIHCKQFEEYYVVSLPNIEYFTFIACKLREEILILTKENKNIEYIKDASDDIINDILYINDILNVFKGTRINKILINSLFYYLIMPVLMTDFKQFIFLFIISEMIFYITDQEFTEMLVNIICLDKLSKGIVRFTEEIPNYTKNYDYDYYRNFREENGKKINVVEFKDYISRHFSKKFIKAIIISNNNVEISDFPYFNEIKDINEKIQEKDKIKLREKEESYFVNELLSFLDGSDIVAIKRYHYDLSLATGINIGIYEDDENNRLEVEKKAFFPKYQKMLLKIKENKTSLLPNHNFEKIIELCSYSKINADNLGKVTIINIFIHSFLNNEFIKKEMKEKIINTQLIIQLTGILFSELKSIFMNDLKLIVIDTIKYIYTNFKEKFKENQIQIVKKSFLFNISSIINKISNEKKMIDNLYVSFIEVWNQYNSYLNIRDLIGKIIQRSDVIIENNKEENKEYEQNIKDLYFSFFHIKDLLFFFNDEINEKAQRFPISEDPYYQFNIGCTISVKEKDFQIFLCVIDDNDYILIITDNVVLFCVSAKLNFATIKEKYYIRDLEMEIIKQKKNSYIQITYKRKKMEMKTIYDLENIVNIFNTKKEIAKSLEITYLKNYFNNELMTL